MTCQDECGRLFRECIDSLKRACDCVAELNKRCRDTCEPEVQEINLYCQQYACPVDDCPAPTIQTLWKHTGLGIAILVIGFILAFATAITVKLCWKRIMRESGVYEAEEVPLVEKGVRAS